MRIELVKRRLGQSVGLMKHPCEVSFVRNPAPPRDLLDAERGRPKQQASLLNATALNERPERST